MMEMILAFVAGGIACLVGVVAALRRANKKPEGTTAKVVTIMGGANKKPEGATAEVVTIMGGGPPGGGGVPK